ncbi:MAG: D-alanyl-D-alanine carboxypeptidase/D-alanyl-D-alanine-endopeptidase [Candidatus Kapaibacterium sp.]
MNIFIQIKNRPIGFYFLIYVSVLLSAFHVYAQVEIPKKPDSLKHKLQQESLLRELKTDIDNLLDNNDFSNAVVGIAVQSLESGEYLYRLNDKKNFLPASTLKVMTTAAALDYLGPEYRYLTELYLDGRLEKSGEFFGNVIIRGTGDPTLKREFNEKPLAVLQSWAEKLDSLGVRSIRGNIIGDDNFFDQVYYGPGWAWDDIPFSYSAQVNALSIWGNRVDINVMQGDSAGEPAYIDIIPNNDYIRVINNVRTAPPDGLTEIHYLRDWGANLIELFGTIKFDTSGIESELLSVTIDNPTLYFLNLFRHTLARKNIRFRGALIDVDDLNERIVYTPDMKVAEYRSPPLSEIIKIINKKSDNLAADMLLKTLGRESSGIGSFDRGVNLVLKYAAKMGISPENINVVDGSGLSRLNLFSPRYQVALLASIYRSSYREIFMNSLASPGEEGTLESRMLRSLAENNVVAKTGSLNGVSTLCGYITTRDRETLAFSIMIMNFTTQQTLAHNLEDLICMRLASFTRKRK